MSRKLSNQIMEMMNRKVRSSTLRDLKRRGLQRVSVLDLSDLNGMIQDAVSRTLQELGIGLRSRELRTQSDRVRDAFLQIVQERDLLERSQADLETELAQLRENFRQLSLKVTVQKDVLAREEGRRIEEEGAPISPRRMKNLKESLNSRLKRLFRDADIGQELVTAAIETTGALIEEERRQAVAEAEAEQESKILVLKRRIAKLLVKLEETEDVLASMADAETDAEQKGVPSLYKRVQGLQKDEKYREEKKEALSKIFSLNLELKKLLGDS